MRGSLVLDTNLLVLLAVGATSRNYIALHKNTKDCFCTDDYELVSLLIRDFSDILVVAHVVAESSALVRQIGDPRRGQIQRVFSDFISSVYELPVESVTGFAREESLALGVTDAILLHVCDLMIDGVRPTLLTIDGPLADRASSLGYSVIDYKRDFQS